MTSNLIALLIIGAVVLMSPFIVADALGGLDIQTVIESVLTEGK